MRGQKIVKHYKIKSMALLISSMLITPITAQAANITNGDFQSNDFTGWTQDVDGFPLHPGSFNDFSIVQPTAGNYAARIEADYWSTPGDTLSTAQDEVFFANTLYQGLDLTASAGQDLVLSFDWVFSGEGAGFDENFIVALGDGSGNYYGADGNLGFLLNPLDYGSGAYSIMLDSSFANAIGWTLEFQMNAGFDGFGSNAVIDNVSLPAVTNTSNNVPEPAVLCLMGLGLIGLTQMQRKNKAS